MLEDKHKDIKEKIIEFLGRNPFYRHAGWFAGVDEETIRRWREEDPEFKARCEAQRATNITRRVNRASDEFILTHADPDTFNIVKKSEVNLVVPKPLLDGLHNNNRAEEALPTEKKD